METDKNEKQELLDKLNALIKKQSQFQQEINELQRQIILIRIKEQEPEETLEQPSPAPVSQPEIKTEKQDFYQRSFETKQKNYQPFYGFKNLINEEFEKFIGENLINKIGIIVLIIGVGIGVKYAIDNDLISPLIRIILGYVLGFGLAGFAIRLKKKYQNFSAVLFSGSMAIHYFITYAAFSYYNLIPQVLAVILLISITILTVTLALYYNQQVISHFGLVGAYIIPYLLKEPFHNATVLFIYMAIINSGILFLSTRKNWKLLNYLAFGATWLIFISWYFSGDYNKQIEVCLTFLTLFFVIFHLAFLSFKLLLKEKFRIDDIALLLANSAILFFLGYNAIETHGDLNKYLGLFTISNAVLHAVTCYIIYRSDLTDKKLFYWTTGLVITFFTITIPVQFNNYITAILWSVESALIFVYAKWKRIEVYEIFSYVLIFITAIAAMINWSTASYNLNGQEIEHLYKPIFNKEFLSSFLVIIFFSVIFFVNRKFKAENEETVPKSNFINIAFPLLLLFIVYFSVFTQISLYWSNVQVNASFELNSKGIWERQFKELNQDVIRFMTLWLFNYTLFFVSVFSFINFRWLKNKNFDAFLIIANLLLILLFLMFGLTNLSGLRESYISTSLPANYDVSIYHLIIRYISLAFFALLLYSVYRFVLVRLNEDILHKMFDVLLCASIIWIGSSELINWLQLSGSVEVYKYQLSILWGVFSLIFIVYGIWKNKKLIRLSAIFLIGVTLIKLFFYDLTNLKTVPKTIVFVSIGILFLIISFLYNKYKNSIFPENINQIN